MKLRDCVSCLVYGTDQRPLARARVEISKEGEVQLYFTTSKLRSIRFKTTVDLYDGQYGVIRCRCELVIQRNSGISKAAEPWMADCEILKVQEMFQRQKDLRVSVNIKTEFALERGIYFIGTIQNISAGGLFLVTPQALAKNDYFTFRYRFGQQMCDLRAKVLRITLVKGEFGCGCQFMGLTPDTEAAIRKFVFAKQHERVQSR